MLLPGLTAVGAEMLHLLGPASAAERSATPADPKVEAAKALMQQANAAFDRGDYAKAQDLAETVQGMNVPLKFFEDTPEELLEEIRKKTGGKMSSKVKTTTEDPRSLVKKAKDALDAGRLDAAQDLARQAEANGRDASWGLFEDTPSSVMKDIQKARSKRDRAEADRLVNQARSLYEKRVPNEEQRAANLDKARTLCLQAAQMHGPYSMWDFGDRPQSLMKDIESARGKLKMPARRTETKDTDVARQPKSSEPTRDPETKQTGYNATKPDAQNNVGPLLGKTPAANKSVLPADPNGFVLPPDVPEPKLANLNPAKANVAEPVDPGAQGDVRKSQAVHLMKEAQNLQRDGKYVEAQQKLAEARKQNATFNPEENSPEMAMQMLVAHAQKQVNELCRVAHENMVKKTAAEVALAEQKLTEAEVIATGLGLDRWAIGEHRSTLRIIKGNTSLTLTVGTPPEMPKPSIDPALILPADPTPGNRIAQTSVVEAPKQIDIGQQMLQQARAEIRAAQFDNARKIVSQVLNGPYACKNDAQDLLRTIDAEELVLRRESARVAFDRAVSAYQNRGYEQALSMFKLVDASMLPPSKQNLLKEMSANAAKFVERPSGLVQAGGPNSPKELPPPLERGGADSLLKQQEALMELQFQKLRSRGLQVEAASTARFGKGETDAALGDLQGFIAEVNAANVDPAKRAMLTRPIEARIERLKVLKHQQDFLTKEAKDLKNFRNQMTQEALHSAHKKEEVAKLMKDFNRLLEEGKYQDASKVAMTARELDPDDPAATAAMTMARTLYRKDLVEKQHAANEEDRWKGWQDAERLDADVDHRNPIKFDKEAWMRTKNRASLGSGLGTSRMRTEKEKQIEQKLRTQSISINFKNTPLDEVVGYLQTYTGINFDIDTRAMREASIDPKMEINSTLKDIRLVSALEVMLNKANLRWVINNEVVQITTQKGAAGKLVRHTVPVADLVIPVQNASYKPTLDLQHMMAQANKMGQLGNMGSSATPVTPITGLPTGTGSLTGTASNSQGGVMNRLQNQPASSGGPVVNRISASGTIEESLIRLITSSVHPETWESMGGPGRLEYYPLGMALVINQSPEVIEEVTRLLESLRRLQDLEVAIEIRYINLSEAFYERIGLDFGMNLNTHNDRTLVNLANAGGGTALTNLGNLKNAGGKIVGLAAPGVPTPDLDLPIQATSFGMAIPPFGQFPNAPGADGGISLGLAFLSDIQVQMFLEAAQGDRRSNIMQAPRLTMFNGQTASLQISEQAFFLTGVNVFAVNGQIVFQPQNQGIPVGINLTLQPVISSDRRFVRLSINQSIGGFGGGAGQGQISNTTFSAPASVPLIPITTIITPTFEGGSQGQPVPFTQYLQQPTFSSIDVQTTVMVPDGGTVVLGGLKALSEGRNEFGPPVLSKVPYLNRLFRNVGYGRTTSNLMMLVTPRIIINREEQERQTGVVEGVGEEFMQ